MLRIRLRRVGKTKKPYYRVVVAEQLAKRDGRFVETLGSYDPHAVPPAANLDADKVKDWIAKGAQPSEAAEKILKRAGIIEAATK
jgi:small subunit ribosomal protein S16